MNYAWNAASRKRARFWGKIKNALKVAKICLLFSTQSDALCFVRVERDGRPGMDKDWVSAPACGVYSWALDHTWPTTPERASELRTRVVSPHTFPFLFSLHHGDGEPVFAYFQFATSGNPTSKNRVLRGMDGILIRSKPETPYLYRVSMVYNSRQDACPARQEGQYRKLCSSGAGDTPSCIHSFKQKWLLLQFLVTVDKKYTHSIRSTLFRWQNVSFYTDPNFSFDK